MTKRPTTTEEPWVLGSPAQLLAVARSERDAAIAAGRAAYARMSRARSILGRCRHHVRCDCVRAALRALDTKRDHDGDE